jgi:hypothetical protein
MWNKSEIRTGLVALSVRTMGGISTIPGISFPELIIAMISANVGGYGAVGLVSVGVLV